MGNYSLDNPAAGTVWITGAGSGIGAALARRFAQEGFPVALSARTEAPIAALAAEINAAGGQARAFALDVLDRAAVFDTVRRIADWQGGIAVLCNNAGLNNPHRHWDDIEFAEWDAVIATNLSGAINVIAATLPIMRACGGGVMIHTASLAGRHHMPAAGVPYGASKHALVDLSASLNAAEGKNGIRSTALCPGEVATPLLLKRPGFDPGLMQWMIQPEDVAELALTVARMNPAVAIHEIVFAPLQRDSKRKESPMSHPVKGVDHLFLLTADLDGSADRWRRLGFTLSPRGTHSPEKGTANYTIIFEHDYFELLGIIADTQANLHQREMIARDGDGLRAIACRIDDAHMARRLLAALGIGAEPVAEFSRPLPLPDGGTGTAAFAVTHFAGQDTPAGFMFMCQHKTPDMVWRPELQTHANTARGLAGIVAVSDDPEQAAGRYARLFAAGQVTPADGGWLVATGADSAPILCLSPAAAAARWSAAALAATPRSAFAAMRVAVRDLSAARAAVAAGGIATHDLPGGFWVAPADTSGVILEFVAS